MIPTAKEHRTGFYVAVGCPGCGGELVLENDFFVLTCAYCESTIRISLPDRPPAYIVANRVNRRESRFAIDRYLREHGEPLTTADIQFKRVYYPYWKVDAILLKTRNRIDEIEHVPDDEGSTSNNPVTKIKKTDISLSPYSITFPAGLPLDGIPMSLGIRTDYVQAQPFTPDNVQDEFRPLPVVLDWPIARERAIQTAGNVGRIEAAQFGKNRTEIFRPAGSLVYFPYLIGESFGGGQFRRWVVDGVSGRVVGRDDVLDEAGEVPSDAAVEFGQLDIDFHRCSNCGYDLPAEQSYLYVCRQCQQVTVIEPHPLLQPRIEVAAGGRRDDRLLPFWLLEIDSEIAGKLRGLAGRLGQASALAIPAFRVGNFEAVYRLARRMSTAASKLEREESAEPDSRFAAANISPSEALVLARVIVARELMKLSSSLELPDIIDGFHTMHLLYVPFHAEHYFFVDSALNAVTVEKNLVPA